MLLVYTTWLVILDTIYVNYPANENGLKWTKMDSFCSCHIQILIFWIRFYPIKVSEFFLMHIKEQKQSNFYSFQLKKHMQTINLF